MDITLFFAIASIVVLVVGYIPYLRDIFAGTTKPHAYTWLIWVLTQGVATAGAFYGGANWGVLSLVSGTLLCLCVFLLSLRYGTKNITRGDTVVLILALSSLVVWWQTSNPLYAVLMVTAIDGMGYVPTLRKTWEEPYSETPVFWFVMVAATVFGILALGAFNWLTLPYLVVIGILNISVFATCVVRRKYATHRVW
jgi:hypothetical protein